MSDAEERRLHRTEVADLVSEALALIADDAPGYVVPLHALHALTEQQLAEAADLLGPLFAELRKLRPFPLWVRDAPARALRLKELARLDGAICVGEPVASEGRECWLEVPAGRAEQGLRELPPGWGLLVRGEGAAWATLRKLAPLRALGLALDGEAIPHGPHGLPARLDLITLDATRADEAALGARVLWSVPSVDLRDRAEQALALTAQVPFSGLLCSGAEAMGCALWFATVRRRPRAP